MENVYFDIEKKAKEDLDNAINNLMIQRMKKIVETPDAIEMVKEMMGNGEIIIDRGGVKV